MVDVDLWALAGGAALYAGGLGTEIVRSTLARSAAERQISIERKQHRQDRREDFELEALLELQEIVLLMARQVGVGLTVHEEHYKATKRWKAGAPPLPDEAGGEGSLVVRRAFIKFKSRLPSEDLRESLLAFQNAVHDASLSPPGDGSNDEEMRARSYRLIKAMSTQLNVTQEALGSRIRELHAA
jgi:hypothetical protein